MNLPTNFSVETFAPFPQLARRMRFLTVLIAFTLFAGPLNAGPSPTWTVPFGHSDSLPILVKVEGGRELKFQVERFVVSSVGAAALIMLSMKVADVICTKQIIAPNFLPFDYWLISARAHRKPPSGECGQYADWGI